MGDFGERLKTLRNEHDLLQKDIAKLMGISQATITNYEKNRRFPDSKTLKWLANYFSVSIDYLLGNSDIPDKAEEIIKIQKSEKKPPVSKKADYFIDLIISDKEKQASSFILENAAKGYSVIDIYTEIFQPALKEIGKLWEENQITVDQEHFCSTTICRLIDTLKQYRPNNNKNGLTAICLPINGELHEIGIKIIAEYLEIAGWQVHYPGINLPNNYLLNAVRRRKPDLLAISVTMPASVETAKNLFDALNNDSEIKNVKTIVGGRAFLFEKNLWQKIGADGYALDGKETVKLANELVKNNY
ncbi:MAG: cobalamin-dependent protein [Bacillota bacterium]